jgi:hypothetical protein
VHIGKVISTFKHFYATSSRAAKQKMPQPSPPPSSSTLINPSNLAGKLTTHDPDTYIVVCLHCLHYFRSLTELLRHRLLNHNILDSAVHPANTTGTLPRLSKDGSWLVAGGDSESSPVTPTTTTAGIHTPSPPPFRMGVGAQQHHQMMMYPPSAPPSRVGGYPVPGTGRSGSSAVFPQQQQQQQGMPRSGNSTPQVRSGSTFSPSAKEFIPASMAGKGRP